MARRSATRRQARLRAIERAEAAHTGRHMRVVLAMMGAFALSCWLTAKGLFDKTIEAGVASAEGMLTAIMSAAVAATLTGAGTIMLFGVAMQAARHQRVQVMALALCLLPFILGISTYNAVLGNAGPASLVYDMRDAAAAHAVWYEGMSADAAGAQSAEASLLPLEASICSLAENELSGGALTGAPGRGAVYAAYASGCTNIRTIVQTLRETVQRTDERREDAAIILEALNAIPKDTSVSVFERQAAFRAKAGELRALVEGSGAENVSERLKAQLEILEASVVSLGVQGGQFGERQAAAIDNLKSSLGQVADTLTDLLDAAPGDAPEAPPALREMGAAVAAYWMRNIPQILLALMIDCMTLWFAGLLVVSRGTVDAGRESLTPRPRAPARERSNS